MINPPQVLPEEPTAVTPHGGFCGGKSQQWLRYPTKPHVRFWAGGPGQPGSLPPSQRRPASDEDGRLSIRQCPDEGYADDGNRGEMCRSPKLTQTARSGRPATSHGMLVKL
jgi:hypothetical protein